MPVNCVPEDQCGQCGRYSTGPDRGQLSRFFPLSSIDRELIAGRRGPDKRLGFVLQVMTVRHLGIFLEDALEVAATVVDCVAGQVGVVDPPCVKGVHGTAVDLPHGSWSESLSS